MLNISGHIAALLHRFDCVVIPDMGGFVANYSPAVLDRKKGVVYPPSKGIIFNKNLVKNDGLLVSEIAHATGTTYNEALDALNHFVIVSKQMLVSGGRIEITGLGYLYFDGEKNIQYLAHQTVNFLNDSFGLNPVMAVPVVKKVVEMKPVVEKVIEKKEEKVEQKTEEKKEAVVISLQEATEKVKKSVKKNKARYYWAAAVLLPVLFYSYWIPFQTNVLQTGELSLSDFNPFAKHEPAIYKLRTENSEAVNTIDTIKNDSYFASIPLKNSKPFTETDNLTEPAIKETTDVETPVSTVGMHFHVIGGCFVNYENAVSQLEELNSNGQKAFLFGQAGGFHRVALGSFATKDEALEFLNKARSNGQPNCWLLEE